LTPARKINIIKVRSEKNSVLDGKRLEVRSGFFLLTHHRQNAYGGELLMFEKTDSKAENCHYSNSISTLHTCPRTKKKNASHTAYSQFLKYLNLSYFLLVTVSAYT